MATFLPRNASAYDFGFLKAPDWMDQYILLALLLMVLFWAGAYLTKPEHVRFSELRKIRKTPLNRFFFVILQILTWITMALVFIGMGLARM